MHLSKNNLSHKRLKLFNIPDIGCNEKGDLRAKPITLLKKLVKAYNNDTSEEKLEDDENRVSNTKLTNRTVHSRKNISNSFTNGNQNPKKLLSTIPTRNTQHMRQQFLNHSIAQIITNTVYLQESCRRGR